MLGRERAAQARIIQHGYQSRDVSDEDAAGDDGIYALDRSAEPDAPDVGSGLRLVGNADWARVDGLPDNGARAGALAIVNWRPF